MVKRSLKLIIYAAFTLHFNYALGTFRPIFPGTKWCGAGDIAKNPNDLGVFRKTDMCCRSHDFCNYNMQSGENKYGLYNGMPFTSSHCKCDEDFYNCLKNISTIVAKTVGMKYFNVLNPQCFKLEYPAVCIGYNVTLLFQRKCAQYALNYNQPPVWQWFDNRRF